MQSISVVIVCKNEEDIIADTLKSFEGLTDDIVVYDNGSTDKTVDKAKQFNVQLHRLHGEGRPAESGPPAVQMREPCQEFVE